MVVAEIIGAGALLVGIGIVGVGVLGMMSSISKWYRVVPTTEAHLVTNKHGMVVYTSYKDGIKDTAAGNAYYSIPEHIPVFGCRVRPIDLTIREVNGEQIAYESGQARFLIDWSLKYKVVDVLKAAKASRDDGELRKMLFAPVEAAVNSVTTNYAVTVLRSSKIEIQEKIKDLIEDDLAAWGLELVSFQLGDFSDTNDSSIISDISRRTEAKISSETRIIVAEKNKEAKMKEAEAAELAGKREIEKDSTIATEKELMKQNVADQNKITQEKESEVFKVQTVKAAEIAAKKAEIEADMKNTVAEKRKIESQRNGEAERLRATEIAESEKIKRIKAAEADAKEVELAAGADANSVKLEAEAEAERITRIAEAESLQISMKGTAEADAKAKMAEAMRQFTPEAVYAMTAEMQIQANKEVGLKSAEALSNAEVKAFIGGKDSFSFDIGALLESFSTANPAAGQSLLNRIARPNDLGSIINVSETANSA